MSKTRDLPECVMVLPTALLMEAGYFQGLSFETTKYTQVILEQKNYQFKKRSDVESDPAYKQLIPYVILKHEDSLFAYRRGKLLAEKRLLADYSIGIGGHISVDDPNLFGIGYNEALLRELNEEIEIQSQYQITLAALINDDTNEVGKVHLGMVHIAVLDTPSVVTREKSINEGKFLSITQLKGNIDDFENWSKICITQIDKLLSQIEGPQQGL